MEFRSYIAAVVLAGVSLSTAQMASHAPTRATAPVAKKAVANVAANGEMAAMAAKTVARVNGAALSELDLRRMMYTIFPYAQQHSGIPKDMEPEVRRGAMDMIVFEELLYQEAKRRNLAIAPEKLAKAEGAFRRQFPEKSMYDEYLKVEFKGSPEVLRERIRRSLLIERMLKSEVDQKSSVTLAQAKQYYDKNSLLFTHGETVAIQTISIIPPDAASPATREEAQKKIFSIAKLGKEAKTSRDFGLIAEQVSEDDWRTKLGDRGTVDIKSLPPEVAKAARALTPGHVSDPIQLGTAWVVIRVNAHTLPGKTPFAEVKTKLLSDLKKQKKNEVRAALSKTLRKDAKIEVL